MAKRLRFARYTRRFGKLRACYTILRGGSVITNFNFTGGVTAEMTAKGLSQFNNVTVDGRRLQIHHLVRTP